MADVKLEEFIKTINQLIIDKHPYTKIIKNTNQLLTSLNELNQMVDMQSIKLLIIDQIQFLMINQNKNLKFEGHMLHCVISGNPGTGKSCVAKILCQIWTSLDIIKKPTKNDLKKIDSLELLEKILKKNNDLMEILNKELTNYYKLVDNIKKDAVYLKKFDDLDRINDILKNTRLLRFSLDKLIDKTTLEVEEEHVVPFIKATREDLVGKYLGSTAPKTKAVLDKALGGVLFIDEAYNLYHGADGSKDSFGEECLAVINEYMSLYPDQLIVIFAGYKDLLLKTIFKVQPGLKRRCGWFFEIESYTSHGLATIFKLQIQKHGWILNDNVQLEKILLKYKQLIITPGDIENLVLQVKLVYATHHFNLLNNTCDNVITKEMILQAIDKYQKVTPRDVESKAPAHMYL
jgi:SpoVK/Ycf46/Vps4 family AAA+-type ATPase